MPDTRDLHSEEDNMLDGLQLRGRSFDVSPAHSRSPSTEDGSFYLPKNNNVSEDDEDNVKSMLIKTGQVNTFIYILFIQI